MYQIEKTGFHQIDNNVHIAIFGLLPSGNRTKNTDTLNAVFFGCGSLVMA